MCDATYKLTYEGFPLLTIGTVDKDRRFYPFGLAIATDETHDDFAWLLEALKSTVKY